MTHDYKRKRHHHPVRPALNVLEGGVIGHCMQRHRHQEFIRFLNTIEAEVPAGKLLHVILDNYAAHKHPKVLAWLARHRRFTFHFTPTSASWINAVEGSFATPTRANAVSSLRDAAVRKPGRIIQTVESELRRLTRGDFRLLAESRYRRRKKEKLTILYM
jgi:hypothetical protein